MRRRHIPKYVEEQNRETSVAARIFKLQQMATANSGLKCVAYSLRCAGSITYKTNNGLTYKTIFTIDKVKDHYRCFPEGGDTMRVLGFVASPRKCGNTDTLVDNFLDGASSAGAEVKKYFLADLSINQCKGCFRNCILEKGMRCKIFRDDMDILLPDMASSDLMLFASPFYLASYTAIMSRFFERCLSAWETEFVGELGSVEAIKILNNPLKV